MNGQNTRQQISKTKPLLVLKVQSFEKQIFLYIFNNLVLQELYGSGNSIIGCNEKLILLFLFTESKSEQLSLIMQGKKATD
jgi:hypothetical protein